MTVIGLTGGIGTGKSTVTEYLISKGFPVISNIAASIRNFDRFRMLVFYLSTK